MNNLALDTYNLITDLVNETPEETVQRRTDNAERREAEQTECDEEMNNIGMCNSDFM